MPEGGRAVFDATSNEDLFLVTQRKRFDKHRSIIKDFFTSNLEEFICPSRTTFLDGCATRDRPTYNRKIGAHIKSSKHFQKLKSKKKAFIFKLNFFRHILVQFLLFFLIQKQVQKLHWQL